MSVSASIFLPRFTSMAMPSGLTRLSRWNTFAASVVCGSLQRDELRELLREQIDLRPERDDLICLGRRKLRSLDMRLTSGRYGSTIYS